MRGPVDTLCFGFEPDLLEKLDHTSYSKDQEQPSPFQSNQRHCLNWSFLPVFAFGADDFAVGRTCFGLFSFSLSFSFNFLSFCCYIIYNPTTRTEI